MWQGRCPPASVRRELQSPENDAATRRRAQLDAAPGLWSSGGLTTSQAAVEADGFYINNHSCLSRSPHVLAGFIDIPSNSFFWGVQTLLLIFLGGIDVPSNSYRNPCKGSIVDLIYRCSRVAYLLRRHSVHKDNANSFLQLSWTSLHIPSLLGSTKLSLTNQWHVSLFWFIASFLFQ